MNAARHPSVTDPTTPPCSEVWTRDSDDEYEESQVDTGTGMVGDSEGGRASDKLLDLNNLIWMREVEARRDEGGGYAANLGHVSTESESHEPCQRTSHPKPFRGTLVIDDPDSILGLYAATSSNWVPSKK